MKAQLLLVSIVFGLAGISACAGQKQKAVSEEKTEDVWKDYPVGYIAFDDQAPETEGSKVYHRIVTHPQDYIAEQARTVLATLYDTPSDSIVPVDTIHYSLQDIEGVSAKDGGNGVVSIFYSTRHIEKSFAANDTAKLFFETRGVLLHELTHAYQLEP